MSKKVEHDWQPYNGRGLQKEITHTCACGAAKGGPYLSGRGQLSCRLPALRIAARECETCFHVRISGQMFTEYQCLGCGKHEMHHNTSVPKYCPECSVVDNCCTRCGNSLGDLQTQKRVMAFFAGNRNKTYLWFVTPNLLLGGWTPQQMIDAGRGKKLLKFVCQQLEENKPPCK
jgi:hypothetical protein